MRWRAAGLSREIVSPWICWKRRRTEGDVDREAKLTVLLSKLGGTVIFSLDNLAMDVHAAASAAAASRLVYLGMAKRQPALLAFLLVSTFGNVVLSFLGLKTASYFLAYMVFQTVQLATEIAVVRELFEITMGTYPGIRTSARWVLHGTLAIVAVGAILLTTLFWGEVGSSHYLYYMLVLSRSVQFGLAAVIISFLVFLSRYPLNLHRNIYVSSNFFGALFLIEAADDLIDSISPRLFSASVDTATVFLSTLLCLGWAAILRSPASEPVTVIFDSAADRELLRQLESLNNTLSRVGRGQ